MQNVVNMVINNLTPVINSVRSVKFPDHLKSAPPLAFQVNFPRLEVVIRGSLSDACLPNEKNTLLENDVLYVPAGGWNAPVLQQPALILSILFGKQQLGFSIQEWDGLSCKNLYKANVPRRGPRVGTFLLQALNELMMVSEGESNAEQRTACILVTGLMSHCLDLAGSQIQTASRSKSLFNAIREYIDENFKSPLTRETVSAEFYISPNYLSHLFQKSGGVGFNEYLNYVRLEHAKMLLKGYDLKIKDIAQSCGFLDSNYFCRTFRNKTERSPSEYRRHYHSQLKNPD